MSTSYKTQKSVINRDEHDQYERQFILSMIQDLSAVSQLNSELVTQYLINSTYRTIFKAIVEVHRNGQELRWVNVMRYLESEGQVEELFVNGRQGNQVLLELQQDSSPKYGVAGCYIPTLRDRYNTLKKEEMISTIGNLSPKLDTSCIVSILENYREKISALDQNSPLRERLEIKLLNAHEITPEEQRWLWRGYIPSDCITLICGPPKKGKSFATIDIAARISTGRPWPDGSPCEPGSVLLISAEDDPAQIIQPRLKCQDADLTKIKIFDEICHMSGGKKHEIFFDLTKLDVIEQCIDQIPGIKAIIIDPLGSYTGESVDMHRLNHMSRLLAPLGRLARAKEIAMIVVCHTRKGPSGSANEAVLGSQGIVGSARSVLHVNVDPENKARRILAPGPGNYAGDQPSFAFEISGSPPVLKWFDEPLDVTADDLLQVGQKFTPGPSPVKRDRATEWLVELLQKGPMKAVDVRKEAAEANITEGTLDRARDALGIKPYKQSGVANGPWMWTLPDKEDD